MLGGTLNQSENRNPISAILRQSAYQQLAYWKGIQKFV